MFNHTIGGSEEGEPCGIETVKTGNNIKIKRNIH